MTRVIVTRAAVVLALALGAGSAARAQQRPLTTEDPETIGAGRILLEGGADYERDVFLPVSGLRGNVVTAPALGVSIGVSSIAEIQIDGGIYQKMSITGLTPAPLSSMLTIPEGATSASDVSDMSIGAKIRFLSEGASRPSMGFRFSTRLPNAGNESGLGRDVQDFTAGLLVGKTIQSVRTVLNVGFQILGDPTALAKQDDLLVFGLSVARAISPRAEIVGEYTGRANFAGIVAPGAEDRGELRFGARFTQSTVRIDGGIIIGVTPRDPEFGFTAGFTWVFDAFRVP